MSMDAEKFLREYSRMCPVRVSKVCDVCEVCEVGRARAASGAVSCVDMLKSFPAVAVKIVERWSQEHPVKTRQSEFLKQWPNASKDTNGVLSITPCGLDSDRSKKCSAYPNCSECRRIFWSEEVH